mgnify:CR=1 FL=1
MNNAGLKVKTKTIYLYVLPFFLLFIIAFVIPLLMAFGISFTNWRGGGNKIDFIALDNYIKLVKDETFWMSFLNNLKFMALMLVFQIGLAFVFAIVVQNKRVKFQGFHRRVIFLPSVLSSVVVAMIWQIVYNKDIGLISAIMEKIGMEDIVPLWLDDPKIVIYSLAIVLIWQFVGQYVIIMMAGFQNVDTSLMEAAKIDGASYSQTVRYVTLPLMKPTLSVCVTLCVSGCMKLFDTIYAMTGGGPGRSSTVTALYAYDVAFKTKQLSYASAVSIGMIILSVILIGGVSRIFREKEEQ